MKNRDRCNFLHYYCDVWYKKHTFFWYKWVGESRCGYSCLSTFELPLSLADTHSLTPHCKSLVMQLTLQKRRRVFAPLQLCTTVLCAHGTLSTIYMVIKGTTFKLHVTICRSENNKPCFQVFDAVPLLTHSHILYACQSAFFHLYTGSKLTNKSILSAIDVTLKQDAKQSRGTLEICIKLSDIRKWAKITCLCFHMFCYWQRFCSL